MSWRPPLWVLDTPGVLPPRIDFGWEGAMRLGALEMIRGDVAGQESVGAYLLYHLAMHDVEALRQFPRTYVMGLRASTSGKLAVDSTMRDLREIAHARLPGEAYDERPFV